MLKKLQKIEERFFRLLMVLATLSIAGALLLIVSSIIYKGLPSLTWEMVSQTPKGGFYLGREGGILNAIVGSLYLATGASLLGITISLPVALYMNIHLMNRKKLVNGIRFVLDLLWGVPSIVYGAFGFSVMIFFGLRSSLLAGVVTITLLVIPIMIRAIDEVLRDVPRGLMETSLSMGSTHAETAYSVYARQCIPGIITAFLLAFGRGIGDAAAVLFTTGYTDHIPTSLHQPTASLPLAIFFQLGSPIPEVKDRAFASALVLTIIILIISIAARLISKHFQRNRVNF